jgi:hypothetical protein
MAANEERGEFDIELGGAVYGMRPSWEAVESFERATGHGSQRLYALASAGDMQLADSATIITECIRAWGKSTGDKAVQAFRVEKITPLVHEAGILLVNKRLALMLFLSITGGIDSKGEIKASTSSGAATAATGAGGSAGSPAQPSAGRPRRSGKARA